jgi:hypothetical protein
LRAERQERADDRANGCNAGKHDAAACLRSARH